MNTLPLRLYWVFILAIPVSFSLGKDESRMHLVVRHESDHYFGWPANGGIWSWGDEILVQYDHGRFQDKPPGSHDIDYNRAIDIDQSRSYDGGLTWVHERTEIFNTEEGELPKKPLKLRRPIDFSDPNTILKFEWAGYFYYSTDRGRSWNGPYTLPDFGCESLSLRTDYFIENATTCTAFWTLKCGTGGEVFQVRTIDGGITWQKGARVSREVGGSGSQVDGAGMPATVRLGPDRWVSCIRNLIAYPKEPWIDCWETTDRGQSWNKISQPVGNEAGTTPPALNLLSDGRLVLTYGHRKPLRGPTSIRAKTSDDGGHTWSDEVIIRSGGGDEDIGYTRNVIRPDGQIVTLYYWNDHEKTERYIAATIWDPSEID